jgi:hypothetical protein
VTGKKLEPDLSEFDALERPAPRCKVGRILDGLSEQDQVNFQAAVDYGRSYALLARWFTNTKGQPVAEESVRKHARGTCAC